MKKQMIKGAAVLAAALYTAVMPVYAEENEGYIEQVYVNMPEIYVYGSFPGDWQQAQAFLGNEALSPMETAEEGERSGTYYYLLLDVSGSVTKEYFREIKKGIQAFSQSLGEGDRMILYTFGEEVKKQLQGDETPEEVEACLENLSNRDQETLLFEAIDQAAEDADRIPAAECMHKALIVITDGEDVAVGKKTAAEALGNLKKKNLPLYALGIRDTDGENITSLGEFSRSTGGRLVTFGPEEGSQALPALKEEIAGLQCLGFRAKSNEADNQMRTFLLQKETGGTGLSWDVNVGRWIPDHEAPVMTVEQVGEKALKVTFSEPVEGADQPSNYRLSFMQMGWSDTPSVLGMLEDVQIASEEVLEETVVPIIGIIKDDKNTDTYQLSVAEPFVRGEYSLSSAQICDISMEKNGLSGPVAIQLEGVDPPLPGDGRPSFLEKYSQALILTSVCACLAVLYLLYQKVRKGRGVVYLDGKAVLASSVDVKQHVALQSPQAKLLKCTVTVKGKYPQELSIPVEKSVIAGRSSICDVFFDDRSMSRQHFALEWDEAGFYVVDLNSTNGTKVNGVKILEKTLLKQGDTIKAGNIELIVRWDM